MRRKPSNQSDFRRLWGLKVHLDNIDYGNAKAEAHTEIVHHVEEGFVLILVTMRAVLVRDKGNYRLIHFIKSNESSFSSTQKK